MAKLERRKVDRQSDSYSTISNKTKSIYIMKVLSRNRYYLKSPGGSKPFETDTDSSMLFQDLHQ